MTTLSQIIEEFYAIDTINHDSEDHQSRKAALCQTIERLEPASLSIGEDEGIDLGGLLYQDILPEKTRATLISKMKLDESTLAPDHHYSIAGFINPTRNPALLADALLAGFDPGAIVGTKDVLGIAIEQTQESRRNQKKTYEIDGNASYQNTCKDLEMILLMLRSGKIAEFQGLEAGKEKADRIEAIMRTGELPLNYPCELSEIKTNGEIQYKEITITEDTGPRAGQALTFKVEVDTDGKLNPLCATRFYLRQFHDRNIPDKTVDHTALNAITVSTISWDQNNKSLTISTQEKINRCRELQATESEVMNRDGTDVPPPPPNTNPTPNTTASSSFCPCPTPGNSQINP